MAGCVDRNDGRWQLPLATLSLSVTGLGMTILRNMDNGTVIVVILGTVAVRT